MAGDAFAAINSTTGTATVPHSEIALLAATVRAKVRGLQIGNTAATAAQGVRWELNRITTAGTATTITAADTKLDLNSASPITVATSTFTAAPTHAIVITDFGFDIVGTYILWFPPGVEPFVVTTGRISLSKRIGADSSTWAGTLYWEEP